MKTFLLSSFLLFSTFTFAQVRSTTYPGNGNSNFGGAIGKGSITVLDSGDSITFRLNRGTGLLDSIVVFYIDYTSGVGITSTSQLTPKGDIYSAAVAGRSVDGRRADLNFSGFDPEAAVVFNKDGGKIYSFPYFYGFGSFDEGGTLNLKPTGTNSAASYSQTISKSELGVTGNVTFKFIGTYIGNNGSRSNEGFGVPFTNYREGSNIESRSYNPYTVTTYNTFSTLTATLPVKLTDIKANKENNYVSVNWSVAQESNIDGYQIQRSGNGINYATIATVSAKNSSVASSYSYKDYSANAGNNYYRILINEKGTAEFSKVVYLNLNEIKSNFGATFIGNKVLNITLNGITADSYKISLINSSGQLVQTEAFQHNGTDQNKLFNLSGSLSKGIYRVVLQSAKENFVTSVLVQ
jgi:hypothetical protein